MFGLFGYPVMTSFKSTLWDGTADYLIIGGGGGGGGTLDGGGGAGGYRTSWGTGADGTSGNSGGLSSLETALILSKETAYSITVGQGGEGGLGWGNTTNVAGHQGRTTSISGSDITTVTTTGGGRGSGHAQGALDDGGPGGSGGGGAANATNSPGGAGVSGEGSNGGNGAATNTAGGGGGGAGAVGQQGTSTVAGDGGDGLASTITGVSVTRAGGGGGGTRQANATTRSNGGAGGGGDGGWQTVASVNWNTSTGSAAEHGRSGYGGGGGGGGYHTTGNMITGGNGGSGTAIIRLPKEANYSASQLIEDLSSPSNCTASYLNTKVYTNDTDFDSVSLLIRGDTLTDLSANTHTLTAYGNAAAGDASPVKYASGSMTFDGSGDYVEVSDHSDFNFGSSDFTIECWAYHSGTMSSYTGITGKRATEANYTPFLLETDNSTPKKMGFLSSAGSSWNVQMYDTDAFPTDQWVHVAATREGNVFTLWINGVAKVTSTSSHTLMTNTNSVYIGKDVGTVNNASEWNGNIEDFRITKGTARYTAAFTPPTASHPDRETSTGGDHVLTFTVATEDPYNGGSANDGTITWTPFKDPSILDGGSASRAATSAAQLLEDYPSLANQDGIYWINKNGTPTQIYCDMTTDGGGWMLYSSFASTNTLDATNYPAWNGNQILYPDAISTYGYAPIGAGITDRHDGVNTFGYTHKTGRLGVFYSSAPQGGIGATTWYGPSDVTELRIDWGQGASNYASGTNYIHINGSQVASMSGGSNTVGQYSFNPAGSSSPYFGVIENGIVGIGYVYMR